MNLPERWREFMVSMGALGEVAEVFADLDRRHREPGRFYHTWEHVADCLAELDAHAGLADRPEAVELALWFHDAVYDPRAADNESRSAELLRASAARLGVGGPLASASAVLVLATAHHPGGRPAGGRPAGGRPGSRDAALVRDIDLAILGSPPPRFAAYEAAVRREYAFLSEAQWRSGRSSVLKGFLDLPRIYAIAVFHDRFEQQARRNLTASRQRLA
jgi:predicted metal-dependent HD superfamily phosphohydrolase